MQKNKKVNTYYKKLLKGQKNKVGQGAQLLAVVGRAYIDKSEIIGTLVALLVSQQAAYPLIRQDK